MKSLYNAGITIVFASGNNGADLDTNGSHDESEVPWVIGVGASGENNDVTTYSDYGQNIDLIAPGGDTQLSVGILGLDDMGFKGSRNQRNIVNNNYAFTDGTSFACPIVAGTVALMYSVNPSLTPAQIRDLLIHTTDKVGNTNYNSNGFDVTKRRAYGKLNTTRAVTAASN
jgi:serine protease